jgi:hypothetical protein
MVANSIPLALEQGLDQRAYEKKDAVIGTLDCEQSVNHLGWEPKTVTSFERAYGASSLAAGLCLGPQLLCPFPSC